MLILAAMEKKQQKPTVKGEFERPVDRYFYLLDQDFGRTNFLLIIVFLFMAFFGIMGLIWMIPFPQLEFLKKLNAQTFLNWGSFFIAIVVYCYLKLAPTLSYVMLFSIAVMSFFIVQLEYVERDGGPTVVLVCSIVSILALLGLYLVAKSKQPNALIRLLSVGPIWGWSKLFDTLKWKY